MKKGSGWHNESHRHQLAGMGIKTSRTQSKFIHPETDFYIPSRKPTSSLTINEEVESRILSEFRKYYKIPNNSYVQVDFFEEDWDSIEKKWKQIFAFTIMDKDDEIITTGSGSITVINAEVEPNPTYPSILDFKGTLISISFDIGVDE